MNVQENWEVEYWTGKWGCTKAELKAAVQAVGASAEKVEAYLMHQLCSAGVLVWGCPAVIAMAERSNALGFVP